MKIIQKPTTHFEDRSGGVRPTFLILHYTETNDLKSAEDLLLGRVPHPGGGRVSTHYLVDEDGTVIQYVDESKRAWHAGVSYWEGIEDINSHSIGVEIVNPGHANGYREFPPAQMKAVLALCKGILTRHDIPPSRVLAHSDVAPDRRRVRRDPGELFDWKLLAEDGVGLWPVPVKDDFTKAAALLADPEQLRAAFTAVGYDPRVVLEDVITAFQRHYHPEIFKTPEKVGQPDLETLARLSRLQNLKFSP